MDVRSDDFPATLPSARSRGPEDAICCTTCRDGEIDAVWFRDWVARSDWKFAKTMPDSPHWYAQKRHQVEEEFNRVVNEIRKHGFDIRFKGYLYRVFEIDGYIYWPMGMGGNATPTRMQFLINRTNFPSPTAGQRVTPHERLI